MKTIVIGDIHGRTIWKSIVENETFDRVIFIGDYFDTLDNISAAQQIYNFREIVEYKKTSDKIVILLIGNHDHHYFPGMKGQTAGFQENMAVFIQQVLLENKEHLQMAFSFNEFLFSHAGITKNFLIEAFSDTMWNINSLADDVNDLWRWTPQCFMFNTMCSDLYGNSVEQSPIWIRPRALMKGAQDFKKRWIQVVGHTAVKKIDIKGKATGGRYYFIDALGTSKEYLVIDDDGNVTTKVAIDQQ